MTKLDELYDPAEHRPTAGGPWSDSTARIAIAEIAADALDAYRGPQALWRGHPLDHAPDALERPHRNLYLGAAGVAWALHRLAALGLTPPLPDAHALGDTLAEDFRADPELAELQTGVPPPPPGLLFGEAGIVSSLAGLPAHGDTDRLLLAGGELTWRAGALRKGLGLCHGTAGNGYALLTLHARSGDERWLARARAFGMDAAAEVTAARARHGRGRFSLFTGDIGVALFLTACLSPGAPVRFPFLDDALSGPA